VWQVGQDYQAAVTQEFGAAEILVFDEAAHAFE
jgi:hypothetical protein